MLNKETRKIVCLYYFFLYFRVVSRKFFSPSIPNKIQGTFKGWNKIYVKVCKLYELFLSWNKLLIKKFVRNHTSWNNWINNPLVLMEKFSSTHLDLGMRCMQPVLHVYSFYIVQQVAFYPFLFNLMEILNLKSLSALWQFSFPCDFICFFSLIFLKGISP